MRWCFWAGAISVAAIVRAAPRQTSLHRPGGAELATDATVLALKATSLDVLLWGSDISGSDARGQIKEEIDQEQDDNGNGLLAWAATRSQTHPGEQAPDCTDCFLIVGVKSRVVEGFPNRQLIRSTWANPTTTRSLHTRVVFLACEPDPAQHTDINSTTEALAREKHVYGDLLTHELGGCVDSYYHLVDKIKGFYHWVSVNHPTAAFVLTADDDVYVRLDCLVAILRDETTPRTRYYAGQVTSAQLGQYLPTIRDPTHKNYVSESDYPLSVHIPRAIGAHFVLSMDLIEFIAGNRHDLRGVGSIEDLTIGLWMLTLLQVHPVHFTNFDTISLSICRNSLVSYGDLSPHGVWQMHKNVVDGDPICRDFSWATWVNAGAKQWEFTASGPVEDVAYDWHFRLDAATRAFVIDIEVQLIRMSLTLPRISYIPSEESPFSFCARFYKTLAQPHQPLPPVLCDGLLTSLTTYLENSPPLNSALFALTESNLPPVLGPSAEVNVWLARTVVRWRALIECLMAEMFPDFHVFVFDEHAFPRPHKLLELTFVAVSAEMLELMPELPQSSRLIVLVSSPLNSTDQPLPPHQRGHGAVWLVSSAAYQSSKTAPPPLHTPVVSMVFSDSVVHSPLQLLSPTNEHKTQVELLAVPQCNNRVQSLLIELQSIHPHHRCTTDDSCNADQKDGGAPEDEQSPMDTVFAFDADVTTYSQYKFVLAFESHQHTPGFIGGTIAAAFLAGSVPIYDGHNATVSRLFNPKAFINCASFVSLNECATFVKQVHLSSALYDAMRNEPPIVNETAFYEVFSWHPDVLDRLRGETADQTQKLAMAERLRDMINSV